MSWLRLLTNTGMQPRLISCEMGSFIKKKRSHPEWGVLGLMRSEDQSYLRYQLSSKE